MIIEEQAFSPSYDLVPLLVPPPPSTSCLSFSVFLCVAGRAYWRERGGGGGAWSSIDHSITLRAIIYFPSKPYFNFCQVRLNFQTLQLRDPDESGICRQDYLQVNNSVLRIRMRTPILGSVPLTNGSGCGSGRPKYIRILHSSIGKKQMQWWHHKTLLFFHLLSLYLSGIK